MSTQLTEEQFRATFGARMRRLPAESPAIVDIWPYVKAVPTLHLNGHELLDGSVECVYRGDDERFEHVLVDTKSKNVFLVVVIDVVAGSIYGHRLLDLNKEYGLS